MNDEKNIKDEVINLLKDFHDGAILNSTCDMTLEDINNEIKAAREERKK